MKDNNRSRTRDRLRLCVDRALITWQRQAQTIKKSYGFCGRKASRLTKSRFVVFNVMRL